ncbi:ABC transporter substrate-binding protein [Rhizorhapis suberifaciens]|uniref:Iron complex transport system substrate-binding protein n=1 Tax=Rhizorhapis suberifaciens TaxID=13656 RepID=A0A840HR96_9SPHN|nr:ABC transporter substrate-binding protein [Rhizorhapis suberifaciens]MBB4640118.1 iron complex transport system substrate-binding protein [Rhizorhapis suberifaciens]
MMGLIALANLTGPAAARPLRIVSLNPCADAILMHIADPSQIAAISHYSHDPRATSIPLSQALRYPATSGTAEEVLAKRPDLVIAGPHVDLPTIHALERQNINLLRIDVPETIEQSQSQIAQIAATLNVPRRGKLLNARIDAALSKARPADDTFIPALIWQGGGMVPGAGTLADDLLRRTGFRNMSSAYGLRQWDILPLEHLLARPPRVLFSAGAAEGKRDRMLNHPAIRRLSHRVAMFDYAPRLLHCAGPSMIDAVTRLAEVRRSLKSHP